MSVEIIIGVKDFLSQVAAPYGLTLDGLEKTFREEIAGDKDFGIFVGSTSKHYVIPVKALKEYFEEKSRPKDAVPEDKSAFEDFMKDGPVAPSAQAPAAKAPVAKAEKSVGK